jgi:hypothetical protein
VQPADQRSSIGIVERGDPRVGDLVASVAGTVGERLPAVTGDIQHVIEEAIPALQHQQFAALLEASIGENVDVALQIMTGAAAPEAVAAPAAAVDYARRLARYDVPATALIRAYRVGQARFLRHCIEELLRQSPGDHLEGLAALRMAETTADYIDNVVEQVLTIYAEARDTLLRDHSAVRAMRIREVLRGDPFDVAATERALDYRLDQHHLAMVLWVGASHGTDSLPLIRRFVGTLGHALTLSTPPLIAPADEGSAWVWLPTKASLAGTSEMAMAAKAEPAVAVALGEPARGIDGFRRSHRQAASAHAVAVAAAGRRPPVTAFVDIAPIAMLCADLESARDWIHETLGDLAVDSTRNEGLRETARVFLQTGGSYTTTADQLFLHRNTAQYRVRKAEEVRGRPLREGRLDVELALLACHWLNEAVLQPAR